MNVINRQKLTFDDLNQYKRIELNKNIDFYNAVIYLECPKYNKPVNIFLKLTNRLDKILHIPVMIATRGGIFHIQLWNIKPNLDLLDLDDWLFHKLEIKSDTITSFHIYAKNQVENLF